jgi:hypothetical protein
VSCLAGPAGGPGSELSPQFTGSPRKVNSRDYRAQLDDGGLVEGRRRIHFTVDASGADRIRLWTDTWLPGEAPGGPRFSFTHDCSGSGLRLLVIQAFSGTVQVGYRAMAVLIP